MKHAPARIVNAALLASTGFSILSVLIFAVYLISRLSLFATTPSFTHNVVVAGVSVAVIAQFFQLLAVTLVLLAWFTLQSMPKKPREMILLFLSLIPFVPVLIFLVVCLAYVWVRLTRRSPERQEEAKKVWGGAVDAFAEIGSQVEGASAPTAGAASVNPAAQPPVTAPARQSDIQNIIRTVVGPVTSESLAKTPVGILASVALLAALSLSAAGFVVTHAPPIFPSGTIREFALPTTVGQPGGITVGQDGNLWFTEAGVDRIGRITTTGEVREFPIPTPFSTPLDIAAGSDGNLWFTEASGNKVGRVTPTGAFQEYTLPQASSVPKGITKGPDGNIWFTERSGNRIGRITPAGSIQEFTLPAQFSNPNSIATGPDGNLWFTEVNLSADKIGRITPNGDVSEFATPGISQPDGIMGGPDGNLWFTLNPGNQIGRITPGGAVQLFTLPERSAYGPDGIAAGPDGNLWFTEGAESHGKIGRITPAGVIMEYALPSRYDAGGGGIAPGPDGNLWFTETATSRVGSITP